MFWIVIEKEIKVILNYMTNKSRHDAIEFEIYHANLCLLNSQIMAIAYCTLRIISESFYLS